jgi:DNA-binding NtrC family response regulator
MITDNNMPKVSGIELLKKLQAARMALPVIMATGTVPTEEFARHPWLRPAALLFKPYTAKEMLIAVKQVLSAADSVAAARFAISSGSAPSKTLLEHPPSNPSHRGNSV